jgi:hypothetical protein
MVNRIEVGLRVGDMVVRRHEGDLRGGEWILALARHVEGMRGCSAKYCALTFGNLSLVFGPDDFEDAAHSS